MVCGSEVLMEYDPTAVQALAAVHETPARRVRVAPAGSGTAFGVQSEPFQNAVTARCAPLGSRKDPTDMQAVELEHDTAVERPFGDCLPGTFCGTQPAAAAVSAAASIMASAATATSPRSSRTDRTPSAVEPAPAYVVSIELPDCRGVGPDQRLAR